MWGVYSLLWDNIIVCIYIYTFFFVVHCFHSKKIRSYHDSENYQGQMFLHFTMQYILKVLKVGFGYFFSCKYIFSFFWFWGEIWPEHFSWDSLAEAFFLYTLYYEGVCGVLYLNKLSDKRTVFFLLSFGWSGRPAVHSQILRSDVTSLILKSIALGFQMKTLS